MREMFSCGLRRYCLRTHEESGRGPRVPWPELVLTELAHETCGGVERLGRVLHDRDPSFDQPSAPHAIVDAILREIAIGRLVLEEQLLELRAFLPPREKVETRTSESVEEDWIEVEIVDPSGRPVPFVLVEIELSNGRKQRQMTNENGWLRLEHIPSGNCPVHLPHWDRSAWRRA